MLLFCSYVFVLKHLIQFAPQDPICNQQENLKNLQHASSLDFIMSNIFPLNPIRRQIGNVVKLKVINISTRIPCNINIKFKFLLENSTLLLNKKEAGN
jgi:hypothetical protein